MLPKEKIKFKDINGVKYKYPFRSCKDCLYKPCFDGFEKCVSDFAKYGCKDYKYRHGDYFIRGSCI